MAGSEGGSGAHIPASGTRGMPMKRWNATHHADDIAVIMRSASDEAIQENRVERCARLSWIASLCSQ
jgi:hypothetical protein